MFQKQKLTTKQIIEHIESLSGRDAEKAVSAVNRAYLKDRPGTIFQSSIDEERAIFQITRRHFDKCEFALSSCIPFALMCCEYGRELLQNPDRFEQNEKVLHGISCIDRAEIALKEMVED
jgi:hypothetical protein